MTNKNSAIAKVSHTSTTNAAAGSSGHSKKPKEKESFSIEEIIKCYTLCYPSHQQAIPAKLSEQSIKVVSEKPRKWIPVVDSRQSVMATSTKAKDSRAVVVTEKSKDSRAIVVTERSKDSRAAVTEISKDSRTVVTKRSKDSRATVTERSTVGLLNAAASQLEKPAKPARKKPHIHRRSVLSRDSFQRSPTSSFHSRYSTISLAMHRAFQPMSRISSGMCTIPSCSHDKHSHMSSIVSRESSAATTPASRSTTSKPSVVITPRLRRSSTVGPSRFQNVVYIRNYVNGFKELCKLIQQFGSTLSFVVQNLTDVIHMIEFHTHGDRSAHYEHVEMMISFENVYKLIARKTKGRDSGTRSFLRLHRSQSFLLAFIKGLKNAGSKAKTSAIAQKAFDNTVSQYYSWLVNKMAGMAFSSLPSISECLRSISNDEPKNAGAILGRMLNTITPVYTRVQEIYAKHHQLKCA